MAGDWTMIDGTSRAELAYAVMSCARMGSCTPFPSLDYLDAASGFCYAWNGATDEGS